MMCFHKISVTKSATAFKTVFENFWIKVKGKMSKLAIFFLTRILIFKLYIISIPSDDAKNLVDFDFHIDQKLLFLALPLEIIQSPVDISQT